MEVVVSLDTLCRRRFAMTHYGGLRLDMRRLLRVVDPPRRLSYTFRWEDPDPEDRETVVTLSLRDIDGTSAELAFTQGDFATERRRALHEEGWTQSFDKLDELMASATPA
jgi:uncharacterized protein YndB with AHSA1/START domain